MIYLYDRMFHFLASTILLGKLVVLGIVSVFLNLPGIQYEYVIIKIQNFTKFCMKQKISMYIYFSREGYHV
ncbi:hypothetical protein HMPREF9087_1667 [Enterococcus casseliflavus ATCC 12755]|uniref:Uncharacterized protein n=1 Tax=Enterococcus casseliflavus ATCC 12755 TaxID=888066 RepID=F0EJS5_ENTCA|nr:hypothetical protein HMPREF9087_1667 [Enterococcus casseliflavus ATCC 12755]